MTSRPGDDSDHGLEPEGEDESAVHLDDEILAEAINAQPGLADEVAALRDHVAYLTERLDQLEAEDRQAAGAPAPWVVYTPPAAAGKPPHEDETPEFTVVNFVAWYNLTYTGLAGSRSRPIPDCWPQHPGLASEIATLAYAWHDAFTGRSAHPHKAQLWHHHDRTGFTDRLITQWTHPHCHDGNHKSAGAPSRPHRYRATEPTAEKEGD